MTFLLRAWPYLLAGFLGFNFAWVIQQSRLDKAINELTEYEMAIGQQIIEEQNRTTRLKEATENDWYKNLNALHDYYKSHPVRVLSPCASMRTNTLPSSSSGAYATSSNPESSAGGATTEVTAEECAVTTLQLLELQAWTQALHHSNNGK